MPRIPKYTLEKNERTDKWELQKDSTGRVVKRYETKADATKGGALERAVGSEGGSVKIQKENGRFQEERTYPEAKIQGHQRARAVDRLTADANRPAATAFSWGVRSAAAARASRENGQAPELSPRGFSLAVSATASSDLRDRRTHSSRLSSSGT